ncbi:MULTISPECIES: extensin family protein [unclassified Bosea (in: a-proteobacteria)]|uniref:extensin-like domain-containing protein n=2 Tax=Boseaceae TaxID=2831100 RepID=UPI0027E397A4|nr:MULTISPECIES: extensin family protein [unclassified Bosea (in: a-proteobacteria)]
MVVVGICLAPMGAAATPVVAPISQQRPPSRPPELRPSVPNTPAPNEAPAVAPQPSSATTPDAPSGQASCLAALAAIPGNRVLPASPDPKNTDPACRVSEPVRVEALAIRRPGGSASVSLDPPPVLSCAMAKTLAGWLDGSVQPLARGHFERDLASLRVGGGHECRRRNRASAGPVSEHATGQALDIFAFKLGSDGNASQVVVEKPEGLAQNRFLDAIRQSACGAFMTTLGPGSDAAHANHLHVDIQERRSRASRFCQ